MFLQQFKHPKSCQAAPLHHHFRPFSQNWDFEYLAQAGILSIRLRKQYKSNIIYVSMNLISPNMQQIAEIFVRPSRHLYKQSDLGSKNILIEGEPVSRLDFQLKNKRHCTLKCSHYSKDKGHKSDNFLIYLHCNSGCRIEGLTYLRLAIENDFNYVVFDFCGSGMSEGNNLGFHQVQDLEAVINYIKSHFNPDAKFSLWGRSMGAVTALRFLALNRQPIKLAVIDSPFESLKKLFLQIGKQKTNFPEILLNVAYKYIKPIIQSKAEFDIDDVDLSELVQYITTPSIFIASKQDSLIPFSQIDSLFNKYRGEKEMFFIEESHNEARNINVIKKVFKTFKKQLLLLQQSELKKQKNSFYSNVPQKDNSKKKLQLTIKSHSQRLLKYQESEDKKPQNLHLELNLLEKKQASCLFGTNKYKREKKASEVILLNNSTQSFVQTKRKPLAPKHFVSEDNAYFEDAKARPKFLGDAKVIEIKAKPKDLKDFKDPREAKEAKEAKEPREPREAKEAREVDGKSKERKTFQHISSKRPPFVELKGKEVRNSFQLRYRS